MARWPGGPASRARSRCCSWTWTASKSSTTSLGHAAGDRLLAQAGDRLRAAVRPADTIARLGGDEFAILLESVDTHADVGTVAHRVQDLFTDPFPLDTKQVTVTTSIGIAATDGHQSADELLSQADAALYRAKGSGRNRYEIFDEPLRRWLHGRLNSEIELRKALTLDEIEVHYQPLQALTARARHRQRGSPGAMATPATRAASSRRVHRARRGNRLSSRRWTRRCWPWSAGS